MTILDVLLIGVGLSMDAFAVSVCKGLASRGFRLRTALSCGIWFGGFQILMPLLGYVLGSTVSRLLNRFSGIIAFALLLLIGINMIRESRHAECDANGADISAAVMFPLALATAIDALMVGVSFAVYPTQVLSSACLIGLTTFVISFCGVKIGAVFGDRFQQKAQLLGGVILILIGLKLLLRI